MSKNTIKADLKKLLKQHFLLPISTQIADEMKDIERIVTHVQSFQSSKKKTISNRTIAKYAAEFHTIVDETWEAPEMKIFSEVYGDLVSGINSLVSEIEEKEFREQSRDRFYALPNDSGILKIKKWWKRTAYIVSKVFRKKHKQQFWNHEVPLRGLAKYHFTSQLILDLQEVTNTFYETFCAQYLKVKEAEESLSDEGIAIPDQVIQEVMNELENLDQLIVKKVDNILEGRFEQFKVDQELVNTLELSSSRFNEESIEKSIKRAEKKWSLNRKHWSNTIYALFEEWRSDLDIFHLKNITLAELDSFKSAQVRNLGAQINPEIEAILGAVKEAHETLSKKLKDPKTTLSSVAKEVELKLGKELVPQLCDKLTSQNVTNLVTKLESNIHKHVENLSEEHVRVKTSTYDEPLQDDDLKKVSLHELISFETLVTFEEDFEGVKKGLFKALEEAISYFADLPQIVGFSISSSLDALEEGKELEAATSICVDGLDRAMTRIVNSRDQLEEAISENSEQLEAIVNKFCEAIIELTYKENVGELRLRIAKAKAAMQAEEVKAQLKEKIKNRKKMIFELGSVGYSKLESVIERVSKKFILTAGKPELTKEASDFLLKSQHVIDSLPLIYKRLYKIEPLANLELFQGREAELEKLNVAYENWNKGHYASTAILGEKWGGLTSFLNFALEKANYSHSITRFSLKDNASTEARFVQLMNELLEAEGLENIDHIVAHLNNNARRIIVLEDLQNLYLRRVGGFDALQLLFQVIARTFKNVFWITTTTIYTWEYLKKTIKIDEYFSYSIELGELSKEQIINIIWKRNRISGYSIAFEPNESQREDKKFLKMSEVDQQQFLKDNYFAELNSFAKSNVSLALIFWLLSTKKMDQSVVTIGEFQKPDLGFLNVMSMDKIYAIHALVLHDGLSEYQLSQVLNITESVSRLTLLSLLEDGVIIKSNLNYMVNPIVYRSAIAVLKSKNLIH